MPSQQEQVQHWLRYLKSQLKKLKDVPLILIGNKEDLISKQQRENTVEYFESLKKQYALEYVIVSARKLENVTSVITVLQQKCLALLNSEYFIIPHRYKRVADRLQIVRKNGKFFVGTIQIVHLSLFR